jgi:hypothetical protein
MAKKAKKKINLRGSEKEYSDRTDIEKIHTQWHKLTGLHSRAEWSAAVVRASTVAEIAANLAIRAEFEDRSKFDASYVDNLLKFANGLDNKMRRLLLPVVKGKRAVKYTGLQKLAEDISSVRNKIVHQGEFLNEDESVVVIEKARVFVKQLVDIYYYDFDLKDQANYVPPKPTKKKR